MAENKSIDGLITRDAKKVAPISKASPKSATKSVKVSHTAKTIKATKAPKAATKTTKPVKIEQPLDSAPIMLTEDTDRGDLQIEISEPDDQNLIDASSREQTVADFLAPVEAFNFDENTPTSDNKIELEETNSPTKIPMKDLKHSNMQEDAISKKAKKSKKSLPKIKPIKKTRRIITIVIISIITLIIGIVIWFVLWGNDILAKITGGQGNIFDLLTFVDEHYEPLKTDENGRTNILAFGTSGYDMEGESNGGVHDGAQLNDSIMIISLDQETGDVAMLSLPRDLKASPTCTATSKINEVYWCNNMDGDNEDAGASSLMTEVGSILGIDFQYYAHLNWGSLVGIVDTLGGIKVTLDEDISDYYYTGAVYEAGVEYEINGLDAVALARARHGTSGGDFSRGASQQKILIGIKNKILEKGLSLPDIMGLASTLGDNLRTNISIEEIKTAAHLLSDFDFDTVRQLSLYPDYMTTGTINGISYVIPKGGVGNYGAIQSYVEKMLDSDPRNYEDPAIIVLNASGTPGVASTEKSSLEDEGYTITDIDDAPAGEYAEGYTVYATTDKPGTAALLKEHYNTELLPIEEAPVTGYDFVIIVNNQPQDS